MRHVILSATLAALLLPTPALAQRHAGPQVRMPGGAWRPGLAPQPAPAAGRWWGGDGAPGGWGAYRRPVRGWPLPGYWMSPRFVVADHRRYGLLPPMPGYRWVRYYDDAVMIDRDGRVRDTIGGVDWDARDAAYDARGADYPPPPPFRDEGHPHVVQVPAGGQPYTTVVNGPGTVTTITVTPAVTTTTTTTEYVYQRGASRRGCIRVCR